MIGWMIVVSMQTPEERNRSDQETKEATTLAQWEVGPGGIDWIEHLVDVSKAEKLYRGGYPNRYSVRASDILPLLVNKLPSYTGPAIIGDDYVRRCQEFCVLRSV